MEGDTIVTWEHAGSKLQFFTPEGEYVRTVILQSRRGVPQMGGLTSDGRAIAWYLDPNPPLSRGQRAYPPQPYVLFSADGRNSELIAELPGNERIGRKSLTGETEAGSLGFGFQIARAVHGRRLYSNRPDQFRVHVLPLDTGAEWAFTRPHVFTEVTARHIEAFRAERLSTLNPNNTDMQTYRRLLDRVIYADHLPAVSRLKVDSEGMIWARLS